MLGPDGVVPMSFAGVQLFHKGQQLHDPDFLCAEGETADSALIATLRRTGHGLLGRNPSSGETQRPLFLAAPSVDTSDDAEGVLTCCWKTTAYVPVDSATRDDGLWCYMEHAVDISATLRGANMYDLADLCLTYSTMRDLEKLVARKVAATRTHRLLAPIYEALLFGR